MLSIIIVYHSGHGHTAKVAHAVAQGVSAQKGVKVQVLAADKLTNEAWKALDAADAIIFGAPTYMGGVSAPFKAFMDASSKRWAQQKWKDKIAAGFTNAGTPGGDNLNTLYQLMVFSMQHSMVWVGTGIMPGELINRLGAFMGVMTQADNASPSITPPECDLETAGMFGSRVAKITAQFAKGKKA